MATGLVILGIGVLLIIVGFSSTHVEIVPGTFRTEEVPGAPTPAAWIILLVGVVLSAVGFGKRILSAVEK
jgi:amino acid transporter